MDALGDILLLLKWGFWWFPWICLVGFEIAKRFENRKVGRSEVGRVLCGMGSRANLLKGEFEGKSRTMF